MFAGFWSSLSIQTEATYESYTKRSGNIPSSFKQMDANIQFNNKSLLNFSATTSGNADCAELLFGYDNGNDGSDMSRFIVYGSLNSINHFSAPKIPDYLIDTFQIDLNNFDYPTITLYEYDNYSGFEDFIQNRFIQPGELWKGVNEYQSKYINAFGLKSNKIDVDDLMEQERQKSY